MSSIPVQVPFESGYLLPCPKHARPVSGIELAIEAALEARASSGSLSVSPSLYTVCFRTTDHPPAKSIGAMEKMGPIEERQLA